MWVVIYMANGEKEAKHIEALLANEGFLVKLQPVLAQNEEDGLYNVLVISSEKHEARKVLAENGY
jgi:hypothetical protein